MSRPSFMIYGAYGYTGQLVTEEALRRGHRPLLAGRSEHKLAALAQRLGLPFVAVDLGDEAALRRALEQVPLVFHAAGPFSRTSDAMIRACLDTQRHYLDVTGEIPVFQNTFAHDAAARERKVALLSGVGFDVVPSDCLALHVAQRLPGATSLELGIAGLASFSPGTLKSMFEGALAGGLVRRGGALVPFPVGRGVRTLRFADRTRLAMPIPWGDLETAWRTTGIPNITTYMAYPRRMVAAARASWPMMSLGLPLFRAVLSLPAVKARIERALDARVRGPDAAARAQGSAQVWACASDDSGSRVESWLQTPDGYALTATAGVRAVEKTLALQPHGALTPARAFGKDFVLELEGTRRFDALPFTEDAAGSTQRP